MVSSMQNLIKFVRILIYYYTNSYYNFLRIIFIVIYINNTKSVRLNIIVYHPVKITLL